MAKSDKTFGQKINLMAKASFQTAKEAVERGQRTRELVKPAVVGFLDNGLTGKITSSDIVMNFRTGQADWDITSPEFSAKIKGHQQVNIFVHGLMASEMIWQVNSQSAKNSSQICFGPALEAATGFPSLYVRYNTGSHISHNGKDLSALLEVLVTVYPQIKKINMIGHSMGGLVIRSAGYYARELHHTWISRLSSVFLLGTPSSGANLEKVSHLTSFILRKIPNLATRTLSKVIDSRSDGIKDLRLGLMVDEDWQHERSDSVLYQHRTKVHPVPGVRYFVFLGTLAKDPDHPLAIYFGDGMVSKKSAEGKSFFGYVDPLSEIGHYRVFPKTGHIKIIYSTEVFEAIREQITSKFQDEEKS